MNPVVLRPEGDTLYALGPTGLLAIDTTDPEVRGQYLTDLKLGSPAMSRDGAALYAVTFEPSRIVRVASGTGEIVATMERKACWSGVLAVAVSEHPDGDTTRWTVPSDPTEAVMRAGTSIC